MCHHELRTMYMRGGGRGAGVYVLGQAGGNCMGWQHYVYESVV